MSALPQFMPLGPLKRRLNRLAETIDSDLEALNTARAVVYIHRGQAMLRLTPKPRVLVPSAPRVKCAMTSSTILEALLAAERGEPVILTRHGVVVALLTPVLED